jgi:hypothetical protein
MLSLSTGLTITDNGLQLAEGGDFQHKLSYEELKFIYPQNCPTKHETATFGKVLLAVCAFFFSVCRVILLNCYYLRCCRVTFS